MRRIKETEEAEETEGVARMLGSYVSRWDERGRRRMKGDERG